MNTLTHSLDTAKAKNKMESVRIVLLSMLAGAILTSIWSYHFVDSVIGDSIANAVLGYDAKAIPLSGAAAGALFAFVTGLAGTFTACNICALSAIAPLSTRKHSAGKALQPLLYLGIGMVSVAGLYGAVGVWIAPNLPQLSIETLGETGYPVRLLQSTVIFVTIGSIFLIWGFISLGFIQNPFSNLAHRYPWAQSAFMGMLIGAFLIGRPFPLFRKMFEYAASTHNPLYGSMAFVLQSLGNIAVMALFFLFLVYGTGGRFERWLQARPNRVQSFIAAALITGGTFFITYWGFRVPSIFGIGWWPAIRW